MDDNDYNIDRNLLLKLKRKTFDLLFREIIKDLRKNDEVKRPLGGTPRQLRHGEMDPRHFAATGFGAGQSSRRNVDTE